MSTILTPSEEQMNVIQSIKDGFNVIPLILELKLIRMSSTILMFLSNHYRKTLNILYL